MVVHWSLTRTAFAVPSQGLDLALLDTPLEGGASGIMDGTPPGLRQQQLKDLVESASHARCWH